VRQYQHMFQVEGAKLIVTPDALEAIAEKALAKDTGARALRSVIEDMMLDVMYELPDMDNEGAEYILDAAALMRRPRLAEMRHKRKESA
jgi:ATP-dependent Clp protease ATP-binding subunit ClpX